MTARYYVHEAHGYEINPHGLWQGSSTSRPQPVAWYVIDRAYAHQVVAIYPRGGYWPTAITPRAIKARAAAIACAVKLNALEETRGMSSITNRCPLCGHPSNGSYCYEHAWAAGSVQSRPAGSASSGASRRDKSRRPSTSALDSEVAGNHPVKGRT